MSTISATIPPEAPAASRLPLPPRPPGGAWGLASTLWFLRDNHGLFQAARRLTRSKVVRLDGLLLRDTPTVVVSDPAELRRIFEDAEQEFLPGYPPSVSEKFPQGINTLTGSTHRRMRAILRRPLTGRALDTAQPLFLALAEASLDECARARTPFPWRDILRDLTFSFIARLTLGAESDNDVRWLARRWAQVGNTIFFPTDFDAMPWWIAPVRRPLERMYRRSAAALDEIRGRVEAAARDRLERPREDILTEMVRGVEEGERLTMPQVIDTALTLLFAGHETTITGLVNFLFFLHEDPAWRARLVDEQASLAARGAPIAMESMREMPLLLCAVKETLRWPPAGITFRTCEHDVALGGCRVPAGWIIGTDICGAHFDRDHWSDPLRWNPGRFEGADERRDLAYLPFGRGRRSCVGEQPAMMEMMTFGALVLRRLARGMDYTLSPRGRRRWSSPSGHRTNPLVVTRFVPAREQ